MKTLEQLYKEVMASDELRKEFVETVKNNESASAWLKKHECGATAEELSDFLKEKSEGEMEDDEVESVAGGKQEALKYSFLTLGMGCVIEAVASARNSDKDVDECIADAAPEWL